MWNLKHDKSTIIKARISVKDFKKLKRIAKQTKSRVKILKKDGLPILLNKYRKRKFFAITFLVIAILIFILTRFIWNIEIIGANKINKEELLEQLKEEGIIIGARINKIETESIINDIMMKRDDLAWMGIDLKGTNAIINIVEAKEKPEIIDETKICNIIAKKDGIITKVNAQNGTAIVNSGDTVKKGDLLVEGKIEGKYTDPRYVSAKADVYAKVWYTDQKTEGLEQKYFKTTDEKENKYQIKINKFKINLNKGVSKFKNYDTITTNKKLKIFSNFYIPVEIIKITNIEKEEKNIKYTEEELENKLKDQLKKLIIENNQISEENILGVNYSTFKDKNNICVKAVLEVEENIAEITENVF